MRLYVMMLSYMTSYVMTMYVIPHIVIYVKGWHPIFTPQAPRTHITRHDHYRWPYVPHRPNGLIEFPVF